MDEQPREQTPLLDFSRLAGRLRAAVIVLGVLALAGAVGEGMLAGLTFAVLFRWGTAFGVAFVFVTAILVGLHAYRGADTAQRRGERLTSDDVGLIPPRRRPRE